MSPQIKRLVVWTFAAVVAGGAAAWAVAHWHAHQRHLAHVEAQRSADEAEAEYRKLVEPAPGRAEFVPGFELCANPESYSGKRVVLSGVVRHSFEGSWLDLEESSQRLEISVSFDWQKIQAPMGDFSQREGAEDIMAMRDIRVVAEGTFRLRSVDNERRYHFMGGPGYFVIDRLFRYESVEKPNQALQPTPTAGTSAAEQPLVPAAVVADL